MNEVKLAGYLGSAPELRYTGSGTAVANARLATDESYRNADGEQIQETEWHNLVFWGRKAEVINEYMDKGSFLIINRGKLQTREWEDRDGETRYTTEVKVLEFEFGPTVDGDAPSGGSSSSPTERQPAPQTGGEEKDTGPNGGSDEEETFEPDDELPF